MFLLIFGPELKQSVVGSLNQSLKTKVRTQAIELEWWQDFPDLTVEFTNVRVSSALKDTPRYLARFHKVKAVVNPLSMITGDTYHIKGFRLSDGYVKPRVNKAYEVNYQVFKNPDTTEQQDSKGNPALDLDNITLRNINIDYRNRAQEEVYEFFTRRLVFSGKLRKAEFAMEAQGKGLIKSLTIAGQSYAENKPVKVQTNVAVNRPENRYTIQEGEITLANADFTVEGSASNPEKGIDLDLTINGQDNNLQTLLSLVPERYRKSFASYSGKGNFYFKADITGKTSARKNPRLNMDFGIEDGTISRGNDSEPLEQVQLKGAFTNGSKHTALTTKLELDDFRANLNGRKLYGSLIVNNFNDHYLNVHLRGRPRLQDLQGLIPNETIPDMEGDFFIDANFAGRLRHLEQVSTIPKVNLKGRMGLEKARFQTPDKHPDLHKLNGNFGFNGNDLMIHRFRGRAGESHFSMDGRLRNLATFMLLPDKQLVVKADLHSRQLNVAPLLTTTDKEGSGADSAFTFALPEYLAMNMNFQCEELNYQRFQAGEVDGRLLYEDETLRLKALDFKAMDGKVNLSGNLKSLPNGNLKTRLEGNGEDIGIQKLFYQMENFGQAVLTHEHLRGDVTASVNLEAAWNPRLEPLLDQLKVTSDVEILNGQLNEFKPMMKLAGLVNVEELKQVNFRKLSNRVVIQNQKVRIPAMAVQSNAFRANFSGTHQFDNTIDYHLKVDLSDLLFGNKEDYETAFGKVVRSNEGRQLNLFVEMTGPVYDPNIHYDQQAVAEKLKKDLKQEGKELKNAIKNPGEKEDDKDDYELEWDQ